MTKKKKLTIGEILTAYEKANGYKSDGAFAKALGVTRQSMSQWLNDVHKPDANWLSVMAMTHMGSWKAELAKDLLRAMDVDITWMDAPVEFSHVESINA